MKEKKCVKCGTIVSKNSLGLCRKCYISTSIKPKMECVKCGVRISKTSAYYGSGTCRKCYYLKKQDDRLFWQNKEWLYEHYINKKMSMPQIADKLDVYQSNIGRWLHYFNIKTRSNGGTKSGKYTDNHGYVNKWVPTHPTASKSRPYKREHVLIMEKSLGRIIDKTEPIHHLNGIRNDNRLENLKLFKNNSEHKKFEGLVSLFAKELMWGDIDPKLKPYLHKLFTQFCQRTT